MWTEIHGMSTVYLSGAELHFPFPFKSCLNFPDCASLNNTNYIYEYSRFPGKGQIEHTLKYRILQSEYFHLRLKTDVFRCHRASSLQSSKTFTESGSTLTHTEDLVDPTISMPEWDSALRNLGGINRVLHPAQSSALISLTRTYCRVPRLKSPRICGTGVVRDFCDTPPVSLAGIALLCNTTAT